MDSANEQLVTQALINRFGFPPENAVNACHRLGAVPALMQEFFNWLNTGQFGTYTVQGHNARELVDQHQQQPVAAYLMLAWFARDPEAAARYLAEGIGKRDQVVISGDIEDVIRKRAARRGPQS